MFLWRLFETLWERWWLIFLLIIQFSFEPTVCFVIEQQMLLSCYFLTLLCIWSFIKPNDKWCYESVFEYAGDQRTNMQFLCVHAWGSSQNWKQSMMGKGGNISIVLGRIMSNRPAGFQQNRHSSSICPSPADPTLLLSFAAERTTARLVCVCWCISCGGLKRQESENTISGKTYVGVKRRIRTVKRGPETLGGHTSLCLRDWQSLLH